MGIRVLLLGADSSRNVPSQLGIAPIQRLGIRWFRSFSGYREKLPALVCRILQLTPGVCCEEEKPEEMIRVDVLVLPLSGSCKGAKGRLGIVALP